MARLASVTNLRSGARVSDIRADDLRAVAEIAEAFDTMTVQSPLQLSRSNGRAALSLEDAFLRRIPHDRTVVITESPKEDSLTLIVRKVRYADRPPQPCVKVGEEYECFYEFDGADFDAFVAIGKVAKDYDDLYHDPNDPLTLDSPYLEAVQRDGYWMVQKAQAEDSAIEPFLLTGMSKDFVLAEPVEGGDEVKIAKPYKLRWNPFHGQTIDGLSYFYLGPAQRVVNFGDPKAEGEVQIVIPRYRIPPGDDRADLIWAVKTTTVMDYGLDSLDPPLVPEELDWLDINADGRAWAQKSP